MKTTIFLFLATLLLTVSCRTDQQEETSYEIVMDSIVVTKFAMTAINGTPWDPLSNPDLQIEFYSTAGGSIQILSDPLLNVDNTQDRSFAGLNWQLGFRKASEHFYGLRLVENDNNSTYTLINLKENFELAKENSPVNIISTDGRFEATLYYHH